MRAERDAWHASLAGVPAERLVFVDESGARTDVTRLCGWGPVGARVVDRVPHGHWKTCTVLAAVRTSGPLAAATIGAAVDACSFVLWVREVLAPRLGPGDVVVMDNLPAHKNPAVAEAVGSAGATLRYLPRYSPDYNPIEHLWSKVKAHLRAAAARTYDALGTAIDRAFEAVTVQDCLGFFAHCGYPAT